MGPRLVWGDGSGTGASYGADVPDDLLGVGEHLEHDLGDRETYGPCENPIAVFIGESIDVIVEKASRRPRRVSAGFAGSGRGSR